MRVDLIGLTTPMEIYIRAGCAAVWLATRTPTLGYKVCTLSTFVNEMLFSLAATRRRTANGVSRQWEFVGYRRATLSGSVGNGIAARRVARLPYLPPYPLYSVVLIFGLYPCVSVVPCIPPRSCPHAPNTLPCDSPLRVTSTFTQNPHPHHHDPPYKLSLAMYLVQ
jgi:hypothetical protein